MNLSEGKQNSHHGWMERGTGSRGVEGWHLGVGGREDKRGLGVRMETGGGHLWD